MQFSRKLAPFLGLAALGLMTAIPALAQSPTYTLQDIASFNGGNGANPVTSLTDVNNVLYGTTRVGGANNAGTVFSYDLTSQTIASLASFNGSGNGANPVAGLTDVNGVLYGTTFSGGGNNDGTVFSYDPTSKTIANLASFTGGGNGANPVAGLTDVSGVLYGTTRIGGIGGGTVFSYDPTSQTIANLASFNGGNGAGPVAGLTDVGGVLYGTTFFGGVNNDGAVFSFNTVGNSLQAIESFGGSNGTHPYAGLTDVGGVLYGTTYFGGANNDGAVFSYDPTSQMFTSLASFNGSNGVNPLASLTDVNGVLYGTTNGGGNGDGAVFSFNPVGNSLQAVASFNSSNGANPQAALTDVGGILYGTTVNGGAHGDGTIFEVTSPALSAVPEPSSVASFAIGGLGLLGLALKARKRRTA